MESPAGRLVGEVRAVTNAEPTTRRPVPWTTTARRDLPLALVAAGTTWFTMLSWRGFAELWGSYLGPLLLVAAVVALGGVTLRAARLPRVVGFVLEVLLVGLVVWLLLGGSLVSPVAS